MFNDFERPRFRPVFNVGCLMDIPTGQWEIGKNGESLINGGLGNFTGIAARPNNFKTALMLYLAGRLRAVARQTHTLMYESEGTFPLSRMTNSCSYDPYLSTIDFEDDDLFVMTDISRLNGDDFFFKFRSVVMAKLKDEKKLTRTTPFLDRYGKQRQSIYPTGCCIDSFSKLQVTTVMDMYEKNKVGDSKNNTDAMSSGKAKNQLLNQIPQITAQSNSYMIMTAHLGDVINMEMFPTDKRQLSTLPKDTALKGVASGFYTLPHNCWLITKRSSMLNRDKMPLYPLDNAVAFEGDTDLSKITMINMRGKNGISGIPIELAVSQTLGIQPTLSEFMLCKDNEVRFGITGDDKNYVMDLYPSVKLSRTKVRQAIDSDARLRKAIQFTADLLQEAQWHRPTERDFLVEPKVLRDDLIAMGYDWDTLLDTRSYWVFEEEEAEHAPYLSMMDLLRMRKSRYIPFWYSKEQKAAIKPLPEKVAK